MTEEQLNLLVEYIDAKLRSLKIEIESDDCYWEDKRAGLILRELTETITGETN